MRFIDKWSYSCAKFLAEQTKENHEKRRVYYFGFQVAIGALFEIVLLIAVSLLLGTLLPTVFMLAVFTSLRSVAGGYHMNTYAKCFATSLALFIVAGCIVQYTYSFWGVRHIVAAVVLSFIAGLFVMARWAPSDTPNKLITKPEEIKKFKTLSIAYVFVWFGVMATLVYFELYLFVLAGCFGLLLEAFTITPAAYRWFDKLSV